MSTQSHQTIQETAVSVIQELSTIVYPTYPTEKELLWAALELRLGRKLHPKPKRPSERVLTPEQLERRRLHRIQMEIDHIKVMEFRESRS